jgi:hypothetical protein
MNAMLHTSPPCLQMLQKAPQAASRRRPVPVAAGWLQRLACWAERQPPQHRLGGLDAYRHF